MNNRVLSGYITLGFLFGVALLVAVQYFSADRISRLIEGNEDVLNEYRRSKILENLQKEILLLDRNGRQILTTGSNRHLPEFNKGVTVIRKDISDLDDRLDSTVSVEELTELQRLVNLKLQLTEIMFDSLKAGGRPVSEKRLAESEAFLLSERINNLAARIDTGGRAALQNKLTEVDRSGQIVMNWNRYVLVLILVLLVAVFLVIMYRLKRQAGLIQRLNESEFKLKNAVRVKENFLANMSHEIRTPLNAILGYTGLLGKKVTDEEGKLHLATIAHSGETLMTIVNDILDLSKIESGMMRLEKIPFNLRLLVGSVVDLFQPRMKEAGLQFSAVWLTEVPGEVRGDPTRLTQILTNLIGNALKFTRAGSITLEVGGREIGDGDVTVVFSVRDTGIGVAPDKQKSIFERFNQADDDTTRNFGGTGLGLSIVRDLVALQNGELKLDSTQGKGTEVRVSIPYQVVDVREMKQVDEQLPQTVSFRSGSRVLVVEDNPINQNLMAHYLQELQIDFEIAGNGAEALEKVEASDFDLVLMDVQMPVMDGYSAARQIRNELRPDLPVVAMTAHAMVGERERSLRHGMNDHMTKPIRKDKLMEVLARYLAHPPAAPGEIRAAEKSDPVFSWIDPAYLRTVSNGDTAYERMMTAQFMKVLPEQLEALTAAFECGDRRSVSRIAHSLKTTVSVMGLDSHLKRNLDALENGERTGRDVLCHVQRVAGAALKEAKVYLEGLEP
ncbi:hypothetical protein GCM10023091_40010 [Ravibacter arvi]|uniref:histidine kinase n=1 Tax=Ravibacter arvi TaxID=2051041 RepID=A0ABP8MB86_9BACT